MIRFDDNFKKRKVVLEGIVTDKWFEMIEEIKANNFNKKKLRLIKYPFKR